MPVCTATTKKNKPCKSYAKKGHKLCSSHLGVVGAPAGNQNARKHGFYASILTDEEKADLITYATELTVGDELGLNRVLIRRAGEYLLENPELTPHQYMIIANLIQNGSRVILQLVQQSEENASIWDDVLDELSKTIGMKL